MNILICDDMPEHADELDCLLHSAGFNISTRVFHNAADVLEYFNSGGVAHVCFLDILMPETNGVELAKALRKEDYSGEIVFLSTSREYAPESYEVKAFSYLLKPPTKESVSAVLTELREAWKKRDAGSVLLKVSGGFKSVLFSDISYAEVIRHEVYFRLIGGGEIAAYATFSEIAAVLLNDPRFVQCHRSYIVNMDDIVGISKGAAIMSGGARIAISRTYRDAKDKYFKREFGGKGK